ncbi:hypothetical protein [Catenulispora rubra]|uniref:hypothetical protein n=1 Tax=Catenulispora rubra TaxID=280293 RepID=UPI0018926038|nr:hypothetical protein [Catenulispora rubra]
MAKSSRRKSDACARSSATGESHREAAQATAVNAPGSRVILDAIGAQARLETELWERFGRPQLETEHIFGIRRVKPGRNTITIELDRVDGEPGAVLTRTLLRRIMVCTDSDGVLYGTPGMRIAWDRARGGLAVTLLGTDADALIIGDFDEDLVARACQEAARDRGPEFDSTLATMPKLHSAEIAELADDSDRWAGRPDPLGSRLLRRAATFGTVVTPFAIDSWPTFGCPCGAPDCTGRMWAVEMFFDTHEFGAENLDRLLCHRRYGAGLRVLDIHGRPGLEEYHYLGSVTENCEGTLQLRFRCWPELKEAAARRKAA